MDQPFVAAIFVYHQLPLATTILVVKILSCILRCLILETTISVGNISLFEVFDF